MPEKKKTGKKKKKVEKEESPEVSEEEIEESASIEETEESEVEEESSESEEKPKKKKKSKRVKDDNSDEGSEDLEAAVSSQVEANKDKKKNEDDSDEADEIIAPAPQTTKLLRSKSSKVKPVVKNVSKADEKYCNELMTKTHDSARFMQWVSKINPKGEVQPRLILLGKYRVYSIKKAKLIGKHSIAREGHFFDLGEVESKSKDEVILKFNKPENREKFVIDLEGDDVGTEIANHINKAFVCYSRNFPPRYRPSFKITPASRLNDINDGTLDDGRDIADGFIPTYKAFCNYYELPIANDFIAFVEAIVERKSTGLDLDQFGGAYRLKPIVSALKHNRYFTALKLSNVFRETAVSAAAVALIKNQKLTSVTVSNVDAKWEGFESLGKVLRGNQKQVVRHFDFSHSQMTDKGAKPFAAGLNAIPHEVESLNLACAKLTDVGSIAIVQALEHNSTAFGNIQCLDLSGNPLQGAVSSLCAMLESRKTSMRKLSVSSSGISVAKVCAAVSGFDLQELDVSGCAIDDGAMDALSTLFTKSTALKRLNLAKSSLKTTQLHALPRAIASGKSKVSGLFVDLSGNVALSQGSTTFQEFLQLCENCGSKLNGLGLRDCSLSSKSLDLVFSSLSENRLKISELELTLIPLQANEVPMEALKSPRSMRSSEDVPRKTAVAQPGQAAPAPENGAKLVANLTEALRNNKKLRSLRLGGGTPLGSGLATLFDALASLKLTSLDVRAQVIGDEGAAQIGAALRDGAKLRSLKMDENGLSAIGFKKLRDGIKDNETLTSFEWPQSDLRALYDSKELNHESIREVQEAIQAQTASNLKTAPTEGDDDDEASEEQKADGSDSEETKKPKKAKSKKKKKSEK